MSKSVSTALKAKRLEAVRSLTRGQGVWQVGSLKQIFVPGSVRQAVEALVGDDFGVNIFEVLERALSFMPDSNHRDAIENALGFGEFESKNLWDRRQKFCEKTGISARTVIRHEERGAELLLHYIDLVLDGKTVDESDESSTELGELRRRVERLEGQVEAILAKLKDDQ